MHSVYVVQDKDKNIAVMNTAVRHDSHEIRGFCLSSSHLRLKLDSAPYSYLQNHPMKTDEFVRNKASAMNLYLSVGY